MLILFAAHGSAQDVDSTDQLPPPVISTKAMKAEITGDARDPRIIVSGWTVHVPDSIQCGQWRYVLEFEKESSTVRDLRGGEVYKVEFDSVTGVVKDTVLTLQYKLVGRSPISHGQIKGEITIRITALIECEGRRSKARFVRKALKFMN